MKYLVALAFISIAVSCVVATGYDDADADDDTNNGLSNAFLQSMWKRKQDAEEVRETQAKSEARRKKAYKNYEQSCEIKGKFKVRTCPTIEQCLANQAKAGTPAPPAKAGPKKGRVFLDRRIAYEMLVNNERDLQDDDNDDDDELAEENNEPAFKRFLFKPKITELQEETNERRNKAFKKYEEYCEKRRFRISSQRNCPAVDKAKCP